LRERKTASAGSRAAREYLEFLSEYLEFLSEYFLLEPGQEDNHF
jgi:hypothetical protein